MIRKLLILNALFCKLALFAMNDEPVMIINSGIAEYNGKTIVLRNKVVVEHGLGKISADSVEITPNTSTGEEEENHSLAMKDNVAIALADGGQLTCGNADINYQQLEGKFYGNEQQEYVIYTEKGTKKEISPLMVKSRHMILQLNKEKQKNHTKRSTNSINSIVAENQVTVSYQNDFQAAADYAKYQRHDLDEENNPIQMAGLIALRSSEKGGTCQIINQRGDIIRANHICIDTLKRHILFAYPKGSLNCQAQQQRIDFSSDTMTWDNEKNILTLRDNVQINQQDMGTLTNNNEIQLFQRIVGNTKQLTSIESQGVTTLSYNDDDKKLTHTLTCYGKVIIDQLTCKTTMDSPRNTEGLIDEDKQVFFQDKMGEIHADKLTIHYTMVENTPILTKIILEGHARILNRSSASIDDLSTFLQFALADIVEYIPQTKELTLLSKEKKRVLFFDRTNNLQVSAPSLKVRRDQATNKDSVQGVGDVRFSFIEKEREQMKKQFNLD